jgi:hypothetical protein
MSKSTTKVASATSAAAAMTTPAQLERLGGHLRKLRLLKSGERLECQSAFNRDPRSARKKDPGWGARRRCAEPSGVAQRIAVARLRRWLFQARFLKRQESFPVSRMSQ